MHSPLDPRNPTYGKDHQKSDDLEKHSRVMERLRQTVIRLASSDPKKRLSPSQITSIEQHLRQAFPVARTPTHPTYASMIFEAINELKEEDGSGENSISKYIVSKYEDLPWAHRRYLSHHLNNLYRNGELVITASRRYTTPGFVIDSAKRRRGRLKIKRGRKRIGDHDDIGEGKLAKSRESLASEIQNSFNEDVVEKVGKSQVKRKRRNLIIDEEEEFGEVGISGVEELEVSRGLEVQGIEGQDKQIEQGGQLCEGETENLPCGLDLQVVEECKEIQQGKGVVSGDKKDKVGVSEIQMCEGQHPQKEQRGCVSGNETDFGVQRSETLEQHLLLEDQPNIFTHEQYLLENGKNVDAEGKINSQHMNGKQSLPDYQAQVESEILLLDCHPAGTELMVVPSANDVKPQVVKARKRRALERIDCELVCGLPVNTPESRKRVRKFSSQKTEPKCRQAKPTPTSADSPSSSKMLKPEQSKRKRKGSARGKKLKHQTGQSAVASPGSPMNLLEYDKQDYTSLADVKIKFNRILPESLSLVEKAVDKAMDGKEAKCFGAEDTPQKLEEKAFDCVKSFDGPMKTTPLFGQRESRRCVNQGNFALDEDEPSVAQQKPTLDSHRQSSNSKMLKFTISQPPSELKLPIREACDCSLEQMQEQQLMQTEPQDLRSLVVESDSGTSTKEPMHLQLQIESKSIDKHLSGAEEPLIIEDGELHVPPQQVLSSSGRLNRFASQLTILQTAESSQTRRTKVETQLRPSEMTAKTNGRIDHVLSWTEGQLNPYEQKSPSVADEALAANENETIPPLPSESASWTKGQLNPNEQKFANAEDEALAANENETIPPLPSVTSSWTKGQINPYEQNSASAEVEKLTANENGTILPLPSVTSSWTKGQLHPYERKASSAKDDALTANENETIPPVPFKTSSCTKGQLNPNEQKYSSAEGGTLTANEYETIPPPETSSWTKGQLNLIDQKFSSAEDEVLIANKHERIPPLPSETWSKMQEGLQEQRLSSSDLAAVPTGGFTSSEQSDKLCQEIDSGVAGAKKTLPSEDNCQLNPSGNVHFQDSELRPKCQHIMKQSKVQAAAESIIAIPDSLKVQHQQNENEVVHLAAGQDGGVLLEGTTSNNSHHPWKEQKRRGRGRPPKRRRGTVEVNGDLLPTQNQHQVLVEPTDDVSGTEIASSRECQHSQEQQEQKHEEILHSELKPTGDSYTKDQFLSNDKHRFPSKDEQKQQEKRPRRGRPPKRKPIIDGTEGSEVATLNAKPVVDGKVENEVATQAATMKPWYEDPGKPVIQKGRGRPPKRKGAVAAQVSLRSKPEVPVFSRPKVSLRSKPEVPVFSKPCLRSDTRNSKLL